MKSVFSYIVFCSIFLPQNILAQTIGTFNSVQPTAQTQTFVLPSTHTFQKIISSGAALTAGGNLGANLDFTGYVPIGGSSTNGYLSISSETTPAECAILSIQYNSTSKLWSSTSSGKVAFPNAEIGNVARFCSGTVTPDNTIIVCEEAVTSGDSNGDGYEDIGWAIEIDPVTRTVINQDGVGGADKLWAVGRQAHENVVIKTDESIIYWGADANPTGYMYKFVPTNPGIYTSGNLYVLTTTSGLGTGTWVQVPNSTQAERNATVANSTALGAYNFNGIEDCEIGPDGKIYFAAKGPGVVYRFNDIGSTVNNLEVFVASTSYDVDGAGPFAPESWGIGNDNLAFDGDGNLWVLQDGGRNHIWVVGPTHTAGTPAVRLFATTPLSSEPTGITFSPDYKFMFISFQHPSTSNTLATTDASGSNVVFNTHTTIVVARKENLGTCGAPTVLNTTNITSNSATVNWNTVSGAINYTVEYKLASSSIWLLATNATTALNVDLTTLTAASLYDWRVKANCSFGSGNFVAAQFTTLNSTTCDAPTGLNTTNITTKTARVNWSAVSGATSYKVQYKLSTATNWTNATNATTALFFNLSKLRAGRTYDWRVLSNCGSNTSPYAVSQFTTASQALVKSNDTNSTDELTIVESDYNSGEQTMDAKTELQLTPNPVNHILNVSVGNNQHVYTLKILNVAGVTIYQNQYLNQDIKIDVANFQNGMYYVLVEMHEKVFAAKFIKQ